MKRDPRVAARLEGAHARYNKRRYVSPDPLEFLYDYPDPADREVVALVAASLAYGRVQQVLRSAGRVLEILGPAPAAWVRESSQRALRAAFSGFVHRFTTGDEVAALLAGAGAALRRYGSLEALFRTCLEDQGAWRDALGCFSSALVGPRGSSLLPARDSRSAWKRLNLMLRWLVRRDEVDPGGWNLSPRLLRVPVDTHMHRIGRSLGFTARSAADWKTVEEITAGFAVYAPDDPVRYDFALTRPFIGNHGPPV